jgi:hypothetical protein
VEKTLAKDDLHFILSSQLLEDKEVPSLAFELHFGQAIPKSPPTDPYIIFFANYRGILFWFRSVRWLQPTNVDLVDELQSSPNLLARNIVDGGIHSFNSWLEKSKEFDSLSHDL